VDFVDGAYVTRNGMVATIPGKKCKRNEMTQKTSFSTPAIVFMGETPFFKK